MLTITQIIIIILYLCFVVYIFLIEPNLVKVKDYKIRIRNLPDFLNNLTIVHLSDLHIVNLNKKEHLCINKINQIYPDLIVITGDLIGNVHGINSVLTFINSLKSRYGLFGVFGNEEYQSLYYNHLEEIINSKITILKNSHLKINLPNNKNFFIIGLDDPVFGRDDLERATQGLPKNGFKILLTHSPEIIKKYPKDKFDNFDLILCGHVHGGQVRLPLIGPLLIPSHCPRKYNSGLHKIRKNYILINRGIGTCPLTIRFFCRPEISVIRLSQVTK